MARLTPAQLRDRLALDHEMVTGMRAADHVAIGAFASYADLRAGRALTPAEGAAGRATQYLAEYRFPILTSAKERVDRVVVRFDLLAGNSYPFSAPLVEVASRPVPWSPHFHAASGAVCLGEIWPQGNGRMLAAELIVHVMRLLNFDEPRPKPGYHGWNAAAIRHWAEELQYRPLHPDLVYPVVPTEATHGRAPDDGFRAVSAHVLSPAGDGFRSLVGTPSAGESFVALRSGT